MFKKLTSSILIFQLALLSTSIPIHAGQDKSSEEKLLSGAEELESGNDSFQLSMNYAQAIIKHLAEANLIEYKEEASENDTEDEQLKGNQALNKLEEYLKDNQLSNENIAVLQAISDALEQKTIPQIFKLHDYCEAKNANWHNACATTALVTAGVLIIGGVLVAFSLYPVGLGMGLAGHISCPDNATIDNQFCANPDGQVILIPQSSFGTKLDCPPDYNQTIITSYPWCIVNGTATKAEWVNNISNEVLGATLGSIGGGSVLCCFGAALCGVGACMASAVKSYFEKSAKKRTDQEIAKTELREIFPAIDLAIELIIKNATNKKSE